MEAAPCGLHADGTPRCAARRDGADARVESRRRPLVARPRVKDTTADRDARQGLRRRLGLRRLRRGRGRADHPASQDARRQTRRASRADVRARRLDVRRSRLPAQPDEVALPDRRVRTRLGLAQGVAAASADPARLQAVRRPLPGTLSRRARVRPLEARVGTRPAPRPRDREGPASRRPRDPRPPRLRLGASASRAARR